MFKYLHHASLLQCAHGGQIQLIPPPNRSFYVEGSPILTEMDLLSAMIVGCPQVGPGIKPCTKVTQIILGKSREIRVDGEIPLLENLQAMTDGNPPGMCLVVSNQASNAEIGFVFLGSNQARTLVAAHEGGIPFCEVCEQHPNEHLKLPLPNGVTVRSLTIQSETELTFPNNRNRTRIAVTERVKLTVSGAHGNVDWSITAGHGILSTSSGNSVIFTAHDLEETTTVEARDAAGCTDSISFSIACDFLITKSRLRSIFTTAPDTRLDELTFAFNQAFHHFCVDTCLRKAHFFAQVLTEVGSGANPREESMNYTPKRLKEVFRYFRKNPDEADRLGRTSTHPANQPAIANRAYAKRIGNKSINSGDGWRFRGRGYIQLTGKDNYTNIQREIDTKFPNSNVNITRNFDDIVSIKGALISAMAFWSLNNLHREADKGDTDDNINKVTRSVNRGTPHPEHRRNHFHKTTKKAFKIGQCPRHPKKL